MTSLATKTASAAKASPSHDEIIARAEEVSKILHKNAAKTDAEGWVPEENLQAVREAGLSLLLQPEAFGGNEVDLRTSLEVQVMLGRGCGSTSWVVGLGNVSSFLLALYPEQAQADVWGDDIHARIACVTSPAGAKIVPAEGGWRITGKWRYASGSAYAQWAAVGVMMGDAWADEANEGDSQVAKIGSRHKSDLALALVPLSEGAIERSWDVTGMKGTRSDTVVMNDVFVPHHRLMSYTKLISGEHKTMYDTAQHTLYRTPFPAVFGLCIAASQVGVAQAAMKHAIDFAPTRVHPYSLRPLSQESTVQTLMGEAAYKADSAVLHLIRAADDADRAAKTGVWPEGARAQRMLSDGVAASRYSSEAIQLAIRGLMSSSFNMSNDMQRYWRDCEMASSHAGWSNMQLETYGKALLGAN